jgi:hypothetical protein
LLTALRAIDGHLDALAHPGGLCGGDGGEPLVFRLLTGLAPLRFVPQALVVKKYLFAGRPNKILSTVNALNGAVLELHFGVAPLSVCSFCYLCL